MKQRLDEISLLRPITICLLVIMHAFTMYAGNWSLPEGIHPIRTYFWVQKLSFSCMLEMFVFISGYIFGYQIFELKREYRFRELTLNKLRRLILPSVIFSMLYMACFTDIIAQRQWTIFAYNAIAGYAHMWFLPMLFWCFLCGWLIVKCRLNDIAKLAFLLIVSIFSHLPLPLQLNCACYYLFYFYFGICLYKHREQLISFANHNWIGIYLLFAVYIIWVILQTRTIELFSSTHAFGLSDRFLLPAQKNACKISYALSGVIVLYLIALRYVSNHSLSSFAIKANAYCFGIYLIQQFVLEIIYYQSPLPQVVGSYWLPWIGTLSALVLSYFIVRILLYTKTGKFLLG